MKYTKNIVFTHIPKCAGSSFRYSLIDNAIAKDMQIRPTGKIIDGLTLKQDFQYITGHFPFGVEKFINPSNPFHKRPKIFCTFLREPYDQMISYYYYQHQLGQYSKFKKSMGNSITEFYQLNHDAQILQTRFCAGFIPDLVYRKLPLTISRNVLLKRAQYNLSKRFHYVGCFERLSDEMQRFSSEFHIPYTPVYSQKTKTLNRIKKEDLSYKQLSELKTINFEDFRLYKYAKNQLWKI